MIEYLLKFIESIRDFGIEHAAKRYYSSYPAVVVSNEDPEKRGRIIVTIEQLFGSEPLPTFVVPKDFRYCGKGYGEFYPPEVDDMVWVEFEFGDPLCPIYSGGCYANGEVPEEFTHKDGEEGGGIPQVRGIKTKHGHLLLFDETEDKQQISIKTPYGHNIILDESKDEQKLRIETASHFFTLDDTKDKEAIYLSHKSGAQIQVNEKGDINVFSKGGNYLSMNAEDKGITIGTGKASVFAMDDKITIADGSGKSIISLDDSKIQITTAKDAIIQANAATIDAGAVTVKSMGGVDIGNDISKINIAQTGMIGIGSKSAELLSLIDQFLDAFINQANLCISGAGPCSPLMPPAMVTLIKIKVLLATIKGSV